MPSTRIWNPSLHILVRLLPTAPVPSTAIVRPKRSRIGRSSARKRQRFAA